MSDRDHADTVRQAVHALNQAIAKAADAGLEVTIDVHTLERVGHVSEPKIGVTVRRAV